MSLFILKLIAILTMTADHMGKFFFADDVSWLIVGRIAFPLFAWGIANGYAHTKDAYGYMSRLFLFAIISQVPFSLGFAYLGHDPTVMNIFFTLTLGLLAIIKFRASRTAFHGALWVLLITVLGSVFKVDYGGYGILMIFFFHLTYGKVLSTVLLQTGLFLATQFTVFVLWQQVAGIDILLIHPVQMVSLLSLLPIAMYNGKKGIPMSRLFYWFYPVHLVVLLCIAILIT